MTIIFSGFSSNKSDVNGNININPKCNPCSVSVCNAEDYAIRFLNWLHKISIPDVPGTSREMTISPPVSRPQSPKGGGQRRLTKQKKSNRINKTRQKRKNKR